MTNSDSSGVSKPDVLSGTTLRVYRFLYKEGRALNIHEVQRGLGLSSPSVAQYHLRKLLHAGLAREEESGFVVDRVFFENMIRLRRSVIPLQVTYAVFFATLLVVLLVVLRPSDPSEPLFLFSLVVSVAALFLFSLEAASNFRKSQK